MLAVTVHYQHVRITFEAGRTQAVEHGRALAAIPLPPYDPQPTCLVAQRPEHLAAAVGASVDHHPHRPRMTQRVGDSLQQFGTGIVARDEYEMGLPRGFGVAFVHAVCHI